MKLDNIIAQRKHKKIYQDGDVCIKVFDEGYSKADVFNEALNQARIEQTGLNIPAVREVITIDGKWAIVSDFVKGKTLAQIMQQDSENKDKYIEYLVELQLDIHSRHCPLLNKLKDKMNIKICKTDIDATVRYDLHARLEAMPKHTKVCHGDFNPSNILIAEDETVYIIDWSHASQGNASADAARTYLYFWLKGDVDAAKKYLELFCKKSNTEKQYIQSWLPMVAASQSIEVDEQDKERLLSLVYTADYE